MEYPIHYFYYTKRLSLLAEILVKVLFKDHFSHAYLHMDERQAFVISIKIF